MDAIQTMVGQVDWASKNLAYNLDFIPEDKLNWKPAPTANSAMEITTHLIRAFKMLGSQLRSEASGEPKEEPQSSEPKTREEAKQQVIAAAQEYTEVLRTLKIEDFGRMIDTGFGTYTLQFLAGMAVIDVIHHHGQIAYLQSILGDTESHFDMSLLPS